MHFFKIILLFKIFLEMWVYSLQRSYFEHVGFKKWLKIANLYH